MTTWSQVQDPTTTWEAPPGFTGQDVAFDADIPFDDFVPFDGWGTASSYWDELSDPDTTWTEVS